MVLDSAIGPADISQLGHLPLNANSAPDEPHNSARSLARLLHHRQADIIAGAPWSGLLGERPAGISDWSMSETNIVIVLVPTGTPFSADRRREPTRRYFGHDIHSGAAKHTTTGISIGLILPPLARSWLLRWTNSSKPAVPWPGECRPGTNARHRAPPAEHGPNGLEQPDRSAEGSHRDNRGAAMTAGLQLSGGGHG
jgi:hypothetical protein